MEKEIRFGTFQPRKRAYLYRFSAFSLNFPVGRTDETLTKWKAPAVIFQKKKIAACSDRVLRAVVVPVQTVALTV